MRRIGRRGFLRLAGSGVAAGLAGRARAVAPVSERRFLFVLASGGWDTTRVFAPLFGNAYADMEPDATEAEVGGIRFVDSAQRPSVRSFFEQFASRTCVINGFEVRSIAHERCMRLLLTGQPDAGGDDWGSILAAHSRDALPLPALVLSGSSYTNLYTDQVVRVGLANQLPELLDGRALSASEPRVSPLPGAAESLVDQFVRERAGTYASAAGRGGAARFAQGYATMLDNLDTLRAAGAILDPEDTGHWTCGGVWDQLATALEVLENGLCRSAFVAYEGWCNQTFDTHSGDEMQSTHFEELFQHLVWLAQELDARVGPGGGRLSDEVTLVVCSEMGRHPQINVQGGKDHWTYTSAMLVGSGVRGGQVIGGYDDYAMGRRVDLASGELNDSGTALLTRHIGATLLALGDVDPAEWVDDAEPITAAMLG